MTTWLHDAADQQNVPLRTLTDVQATMREAHQQGAGTWTASLLLKHGRLTVEARDWLSSEYPQ